MKAVRPFLSLLDACRAHVFTLFFAALISWAARFCKHNLNTFFDFFFSRLGKGHLRPVTFTLYIFIDIRSDPNRTRRNQVNLEYKYKQFRSGFHNHKFKIFEAEKKGDDLK